VLARAFEDDPVSAWVLPDQEKRLAGLESMYRSISVPESVEHEDAYVTADGSAAALWIPPGVAKPGPVESLRLVARVIRIWGRGSLRPLRVVSYMESKLPAEPHAHLVFMGVDPDRQGEGIGSGLLRSTLAPLDLAGIPAYLEASTLRNRALYLRHGFANLEQIQLPGGGPPMWRMWREPR